MKSRFISKPESTYRPWVSAVALAGLILILTGTARAGDMNPLSDTAGDQSGGSSVLDGMKFAGEIGAKGKSAFSDDVWVFENGMFASKECEKCGFPKGAYWVRFEEEGIRFRTETKCPITDATLVYNGVVRGDRIEGTYTWTKERWYWTIEKEFWFEGELIDSPDVAAAGARPEDGKSP